MKKMVFHNNYLVLVSGKNEQHRVFDIQCFRYTEIFINLHLLIEF